MALAAAGLGVAALVRSGDRQEEAQRKADAKNDASKRRRLAEDQRPRRVALPADLTEAGSARGRALLELAITRDVRSRVRAGLLDGPVASTSCEIVGSPPRRRRAAGFNCFTLRTTRRAQYTIESGYRFSARVDTGRGSASWCKRNPRPIHPDTGYFVTVPVARECLP